jgi:hypothetical protein
VTRLPEGGDVGLLADADAVYLHTGGTTGAPDAVYATGSPIQLPRRQLAAWHDDPGAAAEPLAEEAADQQG